MHVDSNREAWVNIVERKYGIAVSRFTYATKDKYIAYLYSFDGEIIGLLISTSDLNFSTTFIKSFILSGFFNMIFIFLFFIQTNSSPNISSEHSPIRRMKFYWRWCELKSWVSVHMVRHKIGIEHWVSTQRPDRTDTQDKDRDKLPQGALVNHACEADLLIVFMVEFLISCQLSSCLKLSICTFTPQTFSYLL